MHFKWCAIRKKEMENPKICAQNARSHCGCRCSCSCCCWWSDIIQNSINSMHRSYVGRGRCGRRVQLPNKRTTSHTELPLCQPMSGARHTVHKTWMRHGQKLPHKCELIVQQHATRRAAANCSAAAAQRAETEKHIKLTNKWFWKPLPNCRYSPRPLPFPLSSSPLSNLLKQFALATVWAIKLRAMPNNLVIKLSWNMHVRAY